MSDIDVYEPRTSLQTGGTGLCGELWSESEMLKKTMLQHVPRFGRARTSYGVSKTITQIFVPGNSRAISIQ